MLGHGTGPIPARVMIVGEAWGETEDRLKQPFVGVSGAELNKILHEGGILRAECYLSNVVNARPPNNEIGAWVALKKKDITSRHVELRDKFVLPIVFEGYTKLLQEIKMVEPNVILAFGNLALWALTGEWGVTKWRGSHMLSDCCGVKVIPSIHPAAVLREWKQRAIVVNDVRRAAREMQSKELIRPNWNFIVQPSYQQVYEILMMLWAKVESTSEVWIDFDLETRTGHIACAGLSWSREDAICIPFMTRASREGYWTEEEETWIVWWLYKILTHPQVKVRGQNLLYDCQYTYRHWHFIPKVAQDTMISQHAIFSDLPKSLAFLASTYCRFYLFWKEEGKQI